MDLCHKDTGNETAVGRGNNRDIGLKAQTLVCVLYFPQTHDLLKDSALSATVASHLKQRNDRLSEEGKLFKGIGFSGLVLTHGFEHGRKAL